MLEVLRKFADTMVAKILLSILALSFVSWGIAGYVFGGGMKGTVLTVGNIEVSVSSLQEELRRQKHQMQSILGKNIHMNPMMEQAMLSQVMQNMTFRLLMDQSAADLGLLMTNDQALNLIAKQKEFQDKEGKFSAALFHKILSYNGISEQLYVDEIKKQHSRALLQTAVVDGLNTPVSLASNTYAIQSQKRVVKYKQITTTSQQINKTPKDAELLAVYEQNKHLFIQPEYRTITYVYVLPSHVKTGEKDALKKQDALIKLAEKIENDIIGGSDLATVATEYGVQYGQLPPLTIQIKTRDGRDYSNKVISKGIFEKAFETDEGIETEMLPCKKGYIIMRPEKVEEAAPLAFKQVKSKIKGIWKQAEQNKEAYLKANDLFTKVKEQNKLSGTKKMTLTRAEMKKNPSPFASKVFSSKPKEWFLVKNEKGYVVGQVETIKNINGNAAAIQKTQKELSKTVAGYVFEDYISYLNRTYGVERNDKRINQFFGQEK